jgi:hypothetical protein
MQTGFWALRFHISLVAWASKKTARRWLGVLLLCGWLLSAGSPMLWAQDGASGRAVSLAEYEEALNAAAAILQDASTADLAETQRIEAYARAHARLAAITAVALPGGDVIAVEPLLPAQPAREAADEVATGETGGYESLNLVANGLTRVTTASAQLAASTRDDSAARLALLQQVLARPELAMDEPWWQRAQRWLREQLQRLLPEVQFGEIGGRNWGVVGQIFIWSVVGLGGGALIWLLSYWLQGLLGGFVRDARLDTSAHGDGSPPTAAAARQQARALAGAGNYRQAVRQLYLAALLSLEEQGVVRHDRSLTNRELLRQLHENSAVELRPVEAHLTPVIDTFDTVWYGEREPDRETFARYEAEVERLQDAVARSEKRASAPRAERHPSTSEEDPA